MVSAPVATVDAFVAMPWATVDAVALAVPTADRIIPAPKAFIDGMMKL
jgi:hypothetical protein